eukprot:5705618-Alexandrium_andersonii.AAC.1
MLFCARRARGRASVKVRLLAATLAGALAQVRVACAANTPGHATSDIPQLSVQEPATHAPRG